jgi:hypothetical protein
VSWEARWRDLILAGGVVLVAGCSSERTQCCNLSSDPCCDVKCGGQVTAECRAKRQCEAAGGTYGGSYNPSPGVMATTCSFVHDAGLVESSTEDSPDDAPAPDAGSFSFWDGGIEPVDGSGG